jgi:hypothetical protein
LVLPYIPAPQGVHLALPSVLEDLPTSQSEQYVWKDELLTLPIGQLWHVFIPVVLPNSPGMQGRHDA